MAKFKSWQVCCLLCVGLFCAVALICLCNALLVNNGCSSGSFQYAAVAADSQLCSDIGRNMLQQGGSAVDGAIAALLCTSVVNPQSMGLGGGSIFTIRDQTGSQWIGVPGELRGYEEVHKMYGRLPWAKLFEPTIKLAREGFQLPRFLGRLLSFPPIQQLVKNSALCDLFCNKNKTLLKEGDILKFPKLAETMETIAEQGADALYNGKIGLNLIQDIKAEGGTMKMEDLTSFQVRLEDAWTVPLGNNRMHIPRPPAGGALLAFILSLMNGVMSITTLSVLEPSDCNSYIYVASEWVQLVVNVGCHHLSSEFSLSPKSMEGDKRVHTYQRFIEAVKFANGHKRSIRDPVFSNGESAAHLIDSNFIQRVREMISINRTHDDSYYNLKPSSDHFGTTHVSVLDKDGFAVSATSTINHIFGAAIYSKSTGIILNNELADFCWRSDTVRPGEQPPSSMSPTILESASGGILVIGGSGGSMITSAVALSIMNHLWLGMNLRDAIAAPIVFVDADNNLNFEPGFDEFVIEALTDLGHRVKHWKYFFNVVNAVEKKNGCITAISDNRKMGQAAGY
ncbi:glutathione hydrolase 5 proenzyme isoform X2 [Myripristis murdjan]|uniref:glutathione hydrolase 5 proenzyme isoform X2 n=1 Tax=Myripristis murdjan TaxID=586833 RepID=UPI0011763253|nr:glutathione hydrolase 5 proenzyme-like isoform X2 [Myripristis murdjan]